MAVKARPQDVAVSGLKELDNLLKTLPIKMQRNVMRGSLRSAANEFKEEAKQRVEVGPPSGRGRKEYGLYAGALRDSIRVKTRVKMGQARAFVTAGGEVRKGGPVVYYAHMVEGGTQPHLIKGPVTIGGKTYRNIRHPGARPQPFMRPTFDSKAVAATQKAGEYIKRRLATKHGLNTSGILVEGDE